MLHEELAILGSATKEFLVIVIPETNDDFIPQGEPRNLS